MTAKWSELGVTNAEQLREQARGLEDVAGEGHLEPEQRQRILRCAKALFDAASRFEKGETK